MNKSLTDITFYYQLLFDISKNEFNYTQDLFCSLEIN